MNQDLNPTEQDANHATDIISPTLTALNAEGEPVWKVLVFDDMGRDVISSVLLVSDLRAMGVTMHMCAADFIQGAIRHLTHHYCIGILQQRDIPSLMFP